MKKLHNVLNYKDLKIFQNSEMLSFTLDSILLSRFIKFNKHKNILDVGTNNCIIPLIISKYTDSKITGIEIQKESCKVAIENIVKNNKQNQISVINEDFKIYSRDWKNNNLYDMIICNPPYFKLENSLKKNNSKYKKIARHEFELTLENLIYGSAKLLNNKNDFYMIHIIERLDEVFYLLNKYDFSIKELQIIYPYVNKSANRFLLHAVYKGFNKLEVLKPLICHNNDGTFTKELEKFFND